MVSELPERVLHICLSESWGGLEMYPSRVTPEFQRQGWEVHGVALKGSRVAESFQSVGVDPLVFRTRAAALFSVFRVLAYLKRYDIRVIHAHKSSDMRLGALLASLWPETRLFFTDHMGVKKPKKDFYHRWAYSKLHRLFSISRFTYEANLAAFPLKADRISQLYPGIDLGLYANRLSQSDRLSQRRMLGLPDNTLALALPGRICEAKGHGLWIEALAQLKARASTAKWRGVVIGEASGGDAEPGGYLDQLRTQIASMDLTEHIIFAGFRGDLPQYLQLMDVVCIPSVNEAFGLSVIEAMAAGSAVVGSDSGAIPELINRDRGRTAAPDDPAAWADAIAELISHEPLRAGMGSRSSAWVHEWFGMDRHVRELIDAYRSPQK